MLDFINKYLSDFWDKVDIEFTFKFIIIYLSIIWIVMIVRVMRDIVTRTNNIFYQTFCIILIMITAPIGGILLYLLIRPSITLNERYYNEIEENLEIISEIIEERRKQTNKKTDNLGEFKKTTKKNISPKKKTKIEVKSF